MFLIPWIISTEISSSSPQSIPGPDQDVATSYMERFCQREVCSAHQILSLSLEIPWMETRWREKKREKAALDVEKAGRVSTLIRCFWAPSWSNLFYSTSIYHITIDSSARESKYPICTKRTVKYVSSNKEFLLWRLNRPKGNFLSDFCKTAKPYYKSYADMNLPLTRVATANNKDQHE